MAPQSPKRSSAKRTSSKRTSTSRSSARPRKKGARSPGKSPRASGGQVGRSTAAAQHGERLQKVLASAGIGSRRECEQLILDGRVEVDGNVVTELGTRVVLGKNEVRFDCEPIEPSRLRYYLVHKPMGIVSTNRDQEGRPRVIDLVPPAEHLFTVGRLDRSSEGLIIVTNDGELANKLAHPRYEIPKVYRVTVAGHPTHHALQQLRRGVWLAEGPVRVARLTVKKRQRKNTILEMVLTEGRNREIRRMAAKIGHKVMQLQRIALGPIRLGEMPSGAYRELTPRELKALRDLFRGKRGAAARRRPTARKPAREPIASPEPSGAQKPTASRSWKENDKRERAGRKAVTGSRRTGRHAPRKGRSTDE